MLVLFTMVGILPNPFTSLGVNMELLGSEVFIHYAPLASCFLWGFGPAYFLFNTRVLIGDFIGVRVRGFLNLLRDSLEITILDIFGSKFLKLVGLRLDPLEFPFTGFILFIEALSESVAISNATAELIFHILRVIA